MFHRSFQTLENNKSSFFLFGNPDETLALVYEILLTEPRPGGEILDSDVSMDKAYCPLPDAQHLISLGLQGKV